MKTRPTLQANAYIGNCKGSMATVNAPVDARIIAVCHMLGMEFTHLSHLDATMRISTQRKLCVCESASRDMNTLAIENRGRFIINATMREFKKSERERTKVSE